MIMKRKLPSQLKSEESEKLATTEEATTSTPQKPAAPKNDAPASSYSAPQSSAADDMDVVDDASIAASMNADDFNDDFANSPAPTPKHEDAKAEFSENDIKFDLSDKPFSLPEDIPDPFVSGSFDEEEMVMEAPAGRPEQPAKPSFDRPQGAPHKSFSTEALVDNKPEEATPPKAPAPTPTDEPIAASKANPSSADFDMEETAPSMTAPIDKPTNLPANDDNWDLGDLVDIPSTPSASSVLDDEPTKSPFDDAPKVDSPKTPPWKAKKSGGRTLLPGQHVPSNSGGSAAAHFNGEGSKLGGMISIGIVLALVVGTAVFYQNREGVIESISRWTGTLNDVSQEVPPVAGIDGAPIDVTPLNEPLPTEAVVRADELEPDAEKQAEAEPEAPAVTESTTKVEVLDVAPEEAEKPIVAAPDTELPEDVDRFAALQEAIERKRAERRQKTSAKLESEDQDLDPRDLPPEVVTKRNNDIIRETNKALSEYKKALAEVGNPALKPRPGAFFDGREGGPEGVLPPPTTGTQEPAAKPAPLETYGNPIIEDPAELVTRQVKENDGVRQLEDFDLSMFDRQEERVRIPQYVAPALSANTFPPLEVLSFVPDYGVVGLNRGQEGILLIGESLEGWELIAVYDAYAEFHKGELKKIVTIKDANR